MTIEQTWNNGGYLSGLKGVTIPNNTPSFNEDPRKDVIGLPTMRFRQMMKALRAFSLRLIQCRL